MDHTIHPRLPEKKLTEENLRGASVYGPSDERVGSISHLHGQGATAQAIVEVGGFLGLGSKPVSLTMSRLYVMTDDLGVVHAKLDITRQELEDMPAHRH